MDESSSPDVVASLHHVRSAMEHLQKLRGDERKAFEPMLQLLQDAEEAGRKAGASI